AAAIRNGIVTAVVRARSPAAATAVEQRQFAPEPLQDDLGRLALVAVAVRVFAGLQLALQIDFRALLALLLAAPAKALIQDGDVVPFRLVLALAGRLVAPRLRGGQREGHDLVARGHGPDFRIATEIADQDHLVHASGHRTLLDQRAFRSRRLAR